MTNSGLESVRERFERDADDFDAIYRLERSPFSRWFNTTFRKAVFQRYEITFEQAGDVTGKRVLDIGCGSGVYAADFARRGASRVVGVDFSGNMLKLAREEAVGSGVGNVCEFVQANFLEAELADRFDVAIAMGVFDYLPEPVPFLRKMVSLTGDKVIVSFPAFSLVRSALRRLRYKLAGKGSVYYYSAADVRRIAKDAGVLETHLVPIVSSGGGFILVGKC
jgi:ubiquinone/menaquinone biosynthesis C-methylase UbiE